jgi:hypothetical protein
VEPNDLPDAQQWAAMRPLAAEQSQKRKAHALDNSSKRQQVGSIAEQECPVCGDAEGEQMVLCDFCVAAYHLACLEPPLSEVPAGIWLCPVCAEVPGRLVATKEAVGLSGRWVVGNFKGSGRFWGQLEYVAQGCLQLRYSDGDLYEGVQPDHALGREGLVGHEWVHLQSRNCRVPAGVLRRFEAKGLLVEGEVA